MRTVYATVTGKNGPIRIGGTLTHDGSQVAVHIVNGGMLGLYNIDRFEAGRLSAGTLATLFAAGD